MVKKNYEWRRFLRFDRYPDFRAREWATMMRALAESFMGVVIGEATAQGQWQQQQLQRGGGRRGTADSMQQQRQHWTNSGNNSRQQQNRPLASFAESITDLCDRALHVTLKVIYYRSCTDWQQSVVPCRPFH